MVKRVLTYLMLVMLVAAPLRASAAATGDAGAVAAIHQFYADRNFKPVWTDGAAFTDQARKLPDVLRTAKAHGIDPESYGTSRMDTILQDKKPQTDAVWHQAEIFWTYNLWRYASDLLGQKLDAKTLESVVDGNIEANVAQLAPDTPLYKALQDRLSTLDAQNKDAAESAKAGRPAPIPDIIDFRKTIFRPGMSSPAVPLLRTRMQDFGAQAMPGGTPPETANVYDAALVTAVQKFQQEYGLTDDGAIGAVTLSLLNRNAADERLQLVANLQRLREPHRRMREARRIEVSIARFQLMAFNDDKPVLTMPVVVGQPKRQTISFRTEISGVRLNPTWTAPDTIRNEDLIPQLSTNAAKVVKQHGLKFTKDGKMLDPTLIDWTQMTPQDMAQVRMWTEAGVNNPLGLYRVIMENPYDIYLHDTNHRNLFADSMRALSSGCVRVGNPSALTDFILDDKQGWSPQKTKDLVAKGQTRDVIIENKIPIYLDYMTAWLNDRGHLVLGHDIYALDKPRYNVLVNNVLTTQRNAQKLLDQAASILQPELKEARSDTVLTQTSN